MTAGSSSDSPRPTASSAADQVAAADLLQQVAAGAGDDRRQHRLLVRVAGQHHDARLRAGGADLAAGLDPGAIGQADVHDHQVGLEARRLRRSHSATVPAWATTSNPLATVEQRHEALADDLVVVDDQQSQGALAGRSMSSARSSRRCGTRHGDDDTGPGSPGRCSTRTSRRGASARVRMLARPWCPRGAAARRRRSRGRHRRSRGARAVIGCRAGPIGVARAQSGARCCERLARDRQQLGHDLDRAGPSRRLAHDLDLGRRVAPQLVGQGPRARRSGCPSRAAAGAGRR